VQYFFHRYFKKLNMTVFKFYNEDGWSERKKNTNDAILFEDLRPVASGYISHCRKKINKFIKKKGNHILDFASGPIQYEEYLEYSKNFKVRHCVDFSKQAIKKARLRLGKKGKYYCNDFLKINFKKNFFDTIISLHTIYHISKNKQAKVVRKLISISKRNCPIIIVYSNPETIINKFKKFFFFKKKKKDKIYFYCHNNKWWSQFSKLAEVNIYPWRSFSSQHQKLIFPNNIIGKLMFKILIYLEEKYPFFFSKYFQYQIIVLKKY
jgi:2-polyprenyl-3-methyl-5-hydroxy-6-metoxy-1,4-benzoquinol methylase